MRTGAYGGTVRQTYGVMGDEVKMAARLMGQAKPGQIFVSRQVAEAAANHYLFQNLGPIKVKGNVEPNTGRAGFGPASPTGPPSDKHLPQPAGWTGG
jgi:hypothetical protein